MIKTYKLNFNVCTCHKIFALSKSVGSKQNANFKRRSLFVKTKTICTAFFLREASGKTKVNLNQTIEKCRYFLLGFNCEKSFLLSKSFQVLLLF